MQLSQKVLSISHQACDSRLYSLTICVMCINNGKLREHRSKYGSGSGNNRERERKRNKRRPLSLLAAFFAATHPPTTYVPASRKKGPGERGTVQRP